MKALIRTLLFGAVLGLSYLGIGSTSRADDYWTNHWNWYDNTYRPYYYRNYYAQPYYSQPSYGGYYGNYYAPGPAYSYGNYGYGYTPYRNYYGTGGIGYGQTYGGGSAVNIGGMTFGWR